MITVFLDESGTHAGSEVVLVGAVATPDSSLLEAKVIEAAEDAYADDALWPRPESRRKLMSSGFHFTENNVAVTERFLRAMRVMDYRAHVAYSRHSSGIEGADLLINMYYTLVRNLLLRYRTEEMQFVFEEEPQMNPLYSKLVGGACDDIASAHNIDLNAIARIGSKAAPAMSVVDYVLGVAGKALSESALEYQSARVNRGLPAHLAHLIDFDRGVHHSSRRGIELL